MESISLNKYISSTGICSRREADKMIDSGRVTINGKIAKKGNRVEANDLVRLDGKTLKRKKGKKPTYLLFNKPPGVCSTTDKRDPSNIIDFINYKSRIFPVGRLDKASTGLIILTDNGDIVNRILRKENKNEKEYIVRVSKPITNNFTTNMRNGVHILGTRTAPCQVTKLGKDFFKIILTEGMNRQIRRMCEKLGYKVISLKRIRIMHLTIDGIKQGTYRHFTKEELDGLFERIH